MCSVAVMLETQVGRTCN